MKRLRYSCRTQSGEVSLMQEGRDAPEYLPSYTAAQERGWSPDNILGIEATREQLASNAKDPKAFLSSLVVRSSSDALITLPDGSKVPRLPASCRRTSSATSATRSFLGSATSAMPRKPCVSCWAKPRPKGFSYVEITTDPDNVASRRVVEANAGTLVAAFTKPVSVPGKAIGNRSSRSRPNADGRVSPKQTLNCPHEGPAGLGVPTGS